MLKRKIPDTIHTVHDTNARNTRHHMIPITPDSRRTWKNPTALPSIRLTIRG